MEEYEVTCINKPDRSSSHEHITHIGNIANQWKLSSGAAIRQIESNQSAFYTVDRSTGRKVYIGVVRQDGRSPYLRTHADRKWNDNLLALAECGTSCKLVA
jgi:hypothetical protein